MKNLMTIIFTMFAIAFTFVGCEGDKDDKTPATEEVKCELACTENQECKLVDEKATCVEKVVEEVKCDPACDHDKQECKLVENKPACVDKVPVVEEPECSEAKPCADGKVCKEGKCEDVQICLPACTENQECKCTKSADKSECKCEDKVITEPEGSETVAPVDPCDNKCVDDQKCTCTEAEPPVCVCSENNDPEVTDPCKDKKENDLCGDNKVCDKDLKCVDKEPVPEDPKPEVPVAECDETKACPDDKECKEGKCEEKVTEPECNETDKKCSEDKACLEGKCVESPADEAVPEDK